MYRKLSSSVILPRIPYLGRVYAFSIYPIPPVDIRTDDVVYLGLYIHLFRNRFFYDFTLFNSSLFRFYCVEFSNLTFLIQLRANCRIQFHCISTPSHVLFIQSRFLIIAHNCLLHPLDTDCQSRPRDSH